MDNRAKKLLFDTDRQFRRAVEREFEIIGEALNRLLQADSATGARITGLNRIVGLRNRIVHGYDAVDDATVWGIIEGHLPRLIEEAVLLLGEAGETS